MLKGADCGQMIVLSFPWLFFIALLHLSTAIYLLFFYLVSQDCSAVANNGMGTLDSGLLQQENKFKTDVLPRLKLHPVMKPSWNVTQLVTDLHLQLSAV